MGMTNSFQILFESSNAPSSVYPSSGDTLLDSFVYGSYTAAEAAGLSFAAVSGIVSSSEVDTSRTKGLKTYEKLARLSGTGVPSAYVERAFYYDSLGRLVQTVEKNAMGTLRSAAIFFAMDSANDVLPMAGRPAMMTKSEGCHPDVISSSL